jgi:uncharacterized membrane protein
VSQFDPPQPYAEYPRDSFQPTGEFDRPPGVYFDALADGWTLVKRDLGTWIAMALLAGIVATALSFFSQAVSDVLFGSDMVMMTPDGRPDFSRMGLLIGFSLVANSIAYPVYAGLYWAALKQIRGEQISVPDLFKGFAHFLPLLGYGILYNVLFTLGCMLCIFPGIYIMGAMTPGPLLIIDKGMGPFEAFSESIRVMGSQVWLLGLFAFVAVFAMVILGLLMCCVGVVVTMPVYVVAIALHYHYFWPRVQAYYQPSPEQPMSQ